MRTGVVLARIERIEPRGNGGGKLRYSGPMHLFNGDDYWNHAGAIQAWCGAKAATVDLRHVEDRDPRTALYANICRRCFIQPRERGR